MRATRSVGRRWLRPVVLGLVPVGMLISGCSAPVDDPPGDVPEGDPTLIPRPNKPSAGTASLEVSPRAHGAVVPVAASGEAAIAPLTRR